MKSGFSGRIRSLVVFGAVLMLAGVAQAGQTFKFASGETTGYINDAARWSGDLGTDRNCSQSGTIIATNGVTWNVSAYFLFGAADAANPTVVQIRDGAVVGSDLRPGNGKGTFGRIDVDEGGTLLGGANVGASGTGIVTNNGTYRKSSQIYLL